MSAYCLRVFRGRARLRHPVLADAAVRQRTADSLALLDGVAGVSQGYSSVLLELKSDADPEAIRRALRAAVPAAEESEERSECVRHGIGARRIELRVLLLSCSRPDQCPYRCRRLFRAPADPSCLGEAPLSLRPRSFPVSGLFCARLGISRPGSVRKQRKIAQNYIKILRYIHGKDWQKRIRAWNTQIFLKY